MCQKVKSLELQTCCERNVEETSYTVRWRERERERMREERERVKGRCIDRERE